MKQIMGLAAAIGVTTVCFISLALSPAFADSSASQADGQAAFVTD